MVEHFIFIGVLIFCLGFLLLVLHQKLSLYVISGGLILIMAGFSFLYRDIWGFVAVSVVLTASVAEFLVLALIFNGRNNNA